MKRIANLLYHTADSAARAILTGASQAGNKFGVEGTGHGNHR
jgi:hypothetical protein